MYYIDGTRYDQVDGTGSVVPSVKEDGRDHEADPVKEDGTRVLIPSSFTDGATGLDTWSRLFYLVHGPVTALLVTGMFILPRDLGSIRG